MTVTAGFAPDPATIAAYGAYMAQEAAQAAASQAIATNLFSVDAHLLTYAATTFASELENGTESEPCSKDITSLGINPSDWANALNQVTIDDGPGSLYPLSATLIPGSPEYNEAVARNLTVGGEFSNPQSMTTAYASLVNNVVWINTLYISPLDLQAASSLIAHETLHNLGLTDTTIQSRLGIGVDANNTDNISSKLQTDCFGNVPGYTPTLLY